MWIFWRDALRYGVGVLVLGCVLGGGLASPSSAQDEIVVWADAAVPPALVSLLDAVDGVEMVTTQDHANAIVGVGASDGDILQSTWVFVPVLPFKSYTTEKIGMQEIRDYWAGDGSVLNRLSANNVPVTLVVSQDVLAALEAILGVPAANVSLKIVDAEAVVSELWNGRNVWGIVAFGELSPYLKVLALDEIDVFGRDFQAARYPLSLSIGLRGDMAEAVAGLVGDVWPPSNRLSEALTQVVLSGVTAMTRVTAYYMEELGVTRPGDGLLDFVADADIFHTSNEVSFAENCPTPIRDWASTTFCSNDRYMELLQYIGLDVVELTGNHINDYGQAAFLRTLDLYDAAGMAYFGGGRTPEDARSAWVTQHNGNRIAFIGCNKPGPAWAFATPEQAGAAECDAAFLEQELARLQAENDVVIMTVQDFEFNQYEAPQAQIVRFTTFAQWGADVVVGSQAHQPQGFGFVERETADDAFLHHGLGNLFFDQIQRIENRQLFMDKLVVYEGRLLNVVLYTGIIDDYCCPRPMTGGERRNFLATIFRASGW